MVGDVEKKRIANPKIGRISLEIWLEIGLAIEIGNSKGYSNCRSEIGVGVAWARHLAVINP